MTVRTRIAPSPTGLDLHIGNAYTALVNYVFAKKNGGKFIIRIEDTDRTRFIEGSQERILASLHWLGITYDEGPYRQSERLDQYKKVAEELVEKGHAYYCFCTPQRLEQMRKDQEARHEPPRYDGLCRARKSQFPISNDQKYVIRLKVPKEGTTSFSDLIRGEISFENKLIDDQVILKSDGFPTYHLGVVVDDHLMEISHVIRGEEWISSTPKHILLYQFLGWDLPQYAHVPLLRNPDKSKLSKRKNPVWVNLYKEQGFLPEAILNYLATMAWSHPEGKDIFSVDELMKLFDLKNIQTSAPVFDTEKLRWMNGEYIRKLDDEKLIEQISAFTHHIRPMNQMRQIIPLIRDRMKTLAEYGSLAGFFFQKPTSFERPKSPKLVTLAQSALNNCEWSHEAMEKAIRDAAEKEGVTAKDLFMELRVAVTGKTVGPPLLESLEILGKIETLDRLSVMPGMTIQR